MNAASPELASDNRHYFLSRALASLKPLELSLVKSKPPSLEYIEFETNPSLLAACTLSHESALMRNVTSAPLRLLSASPSSLVLAVSPTLTWSLTQ